MSSAPPHEVLLDVRIVRERRTGVGRYLLRVLEELQTLAPADVRVTGLGREDQHLPIQAPLRALAGRAGRTAPFGLAQQWLLPAALKRERYDLYHYPNFDLPPVARGPIVATCYDLEPLRHPALFPRRLVWFFRLFARRLRRADRVITISEATARDVEELAGVARDRISAVHLGVDAHFTPADAEQRDRVRRRYDLPPRFVLYVGNTMPHKNVGRLVEALAIVRRSCGDAALVIGGAPDKYRPAVEAAIETHGVGDAVRFLGAIEETDLPPLLSSASVFAFPSLYEGFGLPALEAMACGAPVVTSNRASLPEVVGDAAIQVDALDAGALASAIVRLLEDRAESARLAAAGLARARTFTWAKCARAHLDVYRELLSA